MTPMLSAGDLASMRNTASKALPGTAVVMRGTTTSDGGGDYSSARVAAGTFDCRLAPIAATEGEIADRVAQDATWIVTLPALTDVALDDVLQIEGKAFGVVDIRARSFETTRRVEVRKIA